MPSGCGMPIQGLPTCCPLSHYLPKMASQLGGVDEKMTHVGEEDEKKGGGSGVGKSGKSKRRAKKQPQRGLGVEQLERLRLQQRWEMLTDIDQPPLHHPQFHQNHNHTGGDGQPYFGFGPNYNIFGNTGNAHGHGFQKMTPLELSSIQMMQPTSHHCEICVKKKHMINGDGFSSFSKEKEKVGTKRCCDSLGLSLGPGNPIDEGDHFKTKEEVELIAIHGKRNGVRGENSVLMEYEFFPAAATNTAAGTLAVTTGGAASTSNTSFIDLSLKLSF